LIFRNKLELQFKKNLRRHARFPEDEKNMSAEEHEAMMRSVNRRQNIKKERFKQRVLDARKKYVTGR
jgi:hypothetical protein